jgi:hypothetical protein
MDAGIFYSRKAYGSSSSLGIVGAALGVIVVVASAITSLRFGPHLLRGASMLQRAYTSCPKSCGRILLLLSVLLCFYRPRCHAASS